MGGRVGRLLLLWDVVRRGFRKLRVNNYNRWRRRRGFEKGLKNSNDTSNLRMVRMVEEESEDSQVGKNARAQAASICP